MKRTRTPIIFCKSLSRTSAPKRKQNNTGCRPSRYDASVLAAARGRAENLYVSVLLECVSSRVTSEQRDCPREPQLCAVYTLFIYNTSFACATTFFSLVDGRGEDRQGEKEQRSHNGGCTEELLRTGRVALAAYACFCQQQRTVL